jgi:glycosyltransferase involved in cell wall biosynthesis
LGDHNLFYISGNSDQSEIGYTTYYNTKIKESLDKKIILPPNSKSQNQSFDGENIDLSSLYLYAKFSADPVGYCYLSELISSESTQKIVKNFLETLNLEDINLFSFTKRNVLYFRILRFYKDFISQEIGNQSISIEQFVSKPSNKYRNLSLLLEYIYSDREDLRKAFPLSQLNYHKDLELWYQNFGSKEYEFKKFFNQPKVRQVNESTTLETGINLIGNFSRIQSLSFHTEEVAKYLRSIQLNFSVWDNCISFSELISEAKLEKSSEIYQDLSLYVVNGNHMEELHRNLPNNFENVKKKIGWWTWETNKLSYDYKKGLDYVDEIWAVSTYVRDVLKNYTDKKIEVCSVPLNFDLLDEVLMHPNSDLNFDYFIFSFDFLSDFERKNPTDVIKAFTNVFGNNSKIKLIIKSINGQSNLLQYNKLTQLVTSYNNVILISESLSTIELYKLMEQSIGFISLHRSEGFGMHLAESLYLDKPVIATNYSGNVDFMKTENSFLVPYKLVEINSTSSYYSEEAVWAEPDIQSASEKIKYVFDNYKSFPTGQKTQLLENLQYSNLRQLKKFKVR